jgi:hypothetical protein
MHIVAGSPLASFVAVFVGPVQAQSPTQGDYYAPGPTTPLHATAADLKSTQQGDYYVGDKTILNAHRMAALRKCTDGIQFDSDRHLTCMSQEGPGEILSRARRRASPISSAQRRNKKLIPTSSN